MTILLVTISELLRIPFPSDMALLSKTGGVVVFGDGPLSPRGNQNTYVYIPWNRVLGAGAASDLRLLPFIICMPIDS